MTDPKNHDGEPEDITSSGEPDDADTDLDSTSDDATDADAAAQADDSAEADSAEDLDSDEFDDEIDEDDQDVDLDDGDDKRERKEKPVPTGKASRSGNPARAAAADDEAESKTRSRTPVKPKRIGNRWAAPAMLACAAIGLLWIVLYYVFANRDNPVPVMSDLGDWNLIVGMGFIVAAFGFSMKWE